MAGQLTEVEMLKHMLAQAEARAKANSEQEQKKEHDFKPEKRGKTFAVQTFNAISPVGLDKFPKQTYTCSGNKEALPASPMAIMLRSHKLKEEEVAPSVRCIVRCGAGTNNIPVARMTELGIPVFNTPGANANAVKELVICGLLLASRGVVEGINHVRNVINVEEKGDHAKIEKRIESDKSMFTGQEIAGKTLGVIGLGQVGARAVDAALALGMKIIGYDPALTMDAALRLPGANMTRVSDLKDLLKQSDYISLHVPYIPKVTHHLINEEMLALCKPNMHMLNLARGEIVDGTAVKRAWESGKYTGKYICDFTDEACRSHPKFVCIPHLGASTEEAEENSAAMAADTMRIYLETGAIRHSVNFPSVQPSERQGYARLAIVHKNEPGILGQITTFLGSQNINITQQVNSSMNSIAYTLVDIESCPKDPAGLQQKLVDACPAIISLRYISDLQENELGQPGSFFFVKWAKSA